MIAHTSLPDLVLEPMLRMALAEDLGSYGDITTRTVIPAGTSYTARLTAREAGFLACRWRRWPFGWSIPRWRR